MGEYVRSTRHPFACLVFLVPLLAGYEYGVHWLGGDRPDLLRNGADAWLRWGLLQYGLEQHWVAPLIVIGLFTIWSLYRWSDRPSSPFTTAFGMIIESGAFAAVLWAISVNFNPLLDRLGIHLSVQPGSLADSAQARLLVRYVGAGIYEEVIFRLGLFSAVYLLLRVTLLPRVVAGLLAAVIAAILFAAAHHFGPGGEHPVVPIRFAFRALAGFYFTMLYVTRGFGIAVGAHAGYDVLVGLGTASATG
ncbi:MAG: CPBP family intramembrane glutamic endopeptidase [Gemmataceae bacterium]